MRRKIPTQGVLLRSKCIRVTISEDQFKAKQFLKSQKYEENNIEIKSQIALEIKRGRVDKRKALQKIED